jgi:4-oxalocrotonate tautomerase
MPVVAIDVWAGRPAEQKEKLIKSVTEAVAKSLGIAQDQVTIILREIPKENWGAAGEVASKAKK